MCSKDYASFLIGKSTNLNIQNHIYKLYFKNSISTVFYFIMEGPIISDNILLLSADMENLRGLGQQAAMVSNTEDGRFKCFVSTLYGTRYSCYCLPCSAPATVLLLSALYATRYRAALVCLMQHPL